MEFAEIAELKLQKPETLQVGLDGGDETPFLSWLRKYIIERISHFFPYINDDKCHVHFLFPEKFNVDKNTNFVTKVLKIHHPLRQKRVSADLTAALSAGKEYGNVMSVLGEDNKKHIIAVLGCLAMLKATNFNYEKVRKITSFYSDVQAFAGAAAYLMIKAVQSGRKDLIEQTEKFVLLKTASLSENLLNVQHCVLNCAYPAVKNLVGQIKNHGAAAYLDPQGWVDWKKLYDYTLSEAKNIDYSPHAIMDVRQNEGKLLQVMVKQYPERRQMLNILPWCPEYKNSKILQDFVEAQKFYLNNNHQA